MLPRFERKDFSEGYYLWRMKLNHEDAVVDGFRIDISGFSD